MRKTTPTPTPTVNPPQLGGLGPRTFPWSPVSSVWIVSIALVVLAVLPHQIPPRGRRVLRSWFGTGIVLAAAVWIGAERHGNQPVLAIALLLLVVGVWTFPASTPSSEHFTDPVLNKDRITSTQRKQVWFDEEVQHEEPQQIQERTAGPQIQVDEVDLQTPWHVEDVLGENPRGIQERPVSDLAEYPSY